MNNLKRGKIGVLGAGVMGCQIALLCSTCEYNVTLFSRTFEGKKKAKQIIVGYIDMMQISQKLKDEDIPKVLSRINVTSNLDNAVSYADIIIETVVEDFEVKKNLFMDIRNKCRDNTLILTNSSSFVPSSFVECIKNPELFCAMHFYSFVWNTRIVDIMSHPRTSDKTKEEVIEFARSLKQTPIVLKKEINNYVFNSMLNEVVITAIRLIIDDIVDIDDVDSSWKGVLGTNIGPFGIMDAIGLDTIYKIIEHQVSIYDRRDKNVQKYLEYLNSYIKEGRLGVKCGKGFYTYE